ncbi:MAG: ROK family protein [Lentisphaerae bacterium]|nr:ROK family protein [Lentisphaerota bacterium]
MSKKTYLLGFDIGGTKIGIGLGTADGELLQSRRIDNVNTDPAVILPQLVETARSEAAAANIALEDIAAFGISTPSPADIANGIITTPPNNPYWRNVPIKKYLEDNLKIRGCFENDANCAALAEWFFGAGKGCKDMIYLTMSTGIGAGIIAGGQLIQGKSFLAGEIGHSVLVPFGRQCNCGLKGCYEAYAGGRALAQRMQQELAGQPDHEMLKYAKDNQLEKIDLLALEQAARAGVEYAVKLWDEMCLRDAQAFGMLMNIFNPQRIVLGTLAYAAGDFFMEPVKKYLPNFAWPETLRDCELVPSALKREIGSYAGIAGALYELQKEGIL